jgi:hypothetical protein
MQSQRVMLACCGRSGGVGVADLVSRRQYYMSAVFGRAAAPHAPLPPVVHGAVLDVSPQVLVLDCYDGERRFALNAGTTVWQGGSAEPTELQGGERVVVRLLPGHRDVADKVWARIGRVTGTVIEHGPDRLLVDVGRTRPPQTIVISARAATLIQVRFPTVGPGSLIDVIGQRRGEVLDAVAPATSQPATLANRLTRLPAGMGSRPGGISGPATWHEPAGPDEPGEGVAYPAVDTVDGCAERTATGPGTSTLPYLAVGSLLTVRNDCTGASAVLPVTGCGPSAHLFHDRCLTCGPSPRGRVADLTLASFVALGGDPERGCFNATVMIGQPR